MMKRKGQDIFSVIQLIIKSFLDDLSGEEREKYERLINDPDLLNNAKELSDREYILSELKKEPRFCSEASFWKLEEYMHKTKRRKRIRRMAWMAAASMLLFLLGGFYLFRAETVKPVKQEIAIVPMTAKACITLADGVQVDLMQPKREDIKEKDGTLITRDSARVVYNQQEAVTEIIYNELSVPRGGEYMLVLSDGTKVWMNADSRLKFPVQFTEKTREVYLLCGEAYFEVTRDESNPFRVHTSRGVVTVLGTEFNVRDYADEREVVTTLVHGSVKYQEGENLVVLNPGEQVIARGTDDNLSVREVNVREFTGWKDGQYVFYNRTLEVLMRNIERMYDVTVFFVNPEVKWLRFSGDLQKYERVEFFLRYIETGGDVRFVVKDKTISVYKK